MTKFRVMPFLAALTLFLMGCGTTADPTSPATPPPPALRPTATPQATVGPWAAPTPRPRTAPRTTDLPWPTVPSVAQPTDVPTATPVYAAERIPTTLPPTPRPGPGPQATPAKAAPAPTLTQRPTATPRPTPTPTPIRTPTPTPISISTPKIALTAVSTSFSPTTVVLATIGSSDTITVGTVGVPPGADGVQLNIQHTQNVAVTSPACVGIFGAATVLGPTPVSGGTLIGCFLLSRNVSATTGNVMTFVVTRVGTENALLSFGLGVDFATKFADGGTPIGPGVTNTVQVD